MIAIMRDALFVCLGRWADSPTRPNALESAVPGSGSRGGRCGVRIHAPTGRPHEQGARSRVKNTDRRNPGNLDGTEAEGIR